MTRRARARLARAGAEDAFTLIELLVVVVILAILATISVGAFRGLTDRARDAAAKSQILQIVPAVEAYHADHSTYVGMTLPVLRADYDQAIDPAKFTLAGVVQNNYCVESTLGGHTWRKNGPTQPPEELACGA